MKNEGISLPAASERQPYEKVNLHKSRAALQSCKTNEIINIKTPKMTIGRGGGKRVPDHSIPYNSLISRIHARIVCENGIYYVIDLGGANKTFLNSVPLAPSRRYRLTDGDILKFANERFSFAEWSDQLGRA